MKKYELYIDGILLVKSDEVPKQAEKVMKNRPLNSRLILTAMNGCEVYIKEENNLRVSTEKEFEETFKEKYNGK